MCFKCLHASNLECLLKNTLKVPAGKDTSGLSVSVLVALCTCVTKCLGDGQWCVYTTWVGANIENPTLENGEGWKGKVVTLRKCLKSCSRLNFTRFG